MKKILLLGCIILFSTLLFSQTNSEDLPGVTLTHRHGNLYNASTLKKLDVPALGSMLTKDSFFTYCKARAEYTASISMWAIFGAGAIASLSIAMAEHRNMPNYSLMASTFYYTPFICTFALTAVALIPAVVLTVDSHMKLNRVATGYNNGRSLSLGLNGHGLGLTLKF
ncbi:MAG: hypothetical protein J5741_03435 [Bacteroidales bacterium]|nr:hypothetical protein [Bacteroidales bacterium]